MRFNDADLLGLPLRLAVGGRGLAKGVLELKLRRTGESCEIGLDDLVPAVQAAIKSEWQVLEAS